jgi:apolipoprotein N-acyltransferase
MGDGGESVPTRWYRACMIRLASPYAAPLAALILGAIAATGFAPLGWWPLTLGALAGLVWLVAQAPTGWRAVRIGWGFGLGHFVFGLSWIAQSFAYQEAMPAWLGWIAVLLLSLYLALFPALAARLAWGFRGDAIAYPIAFAAAWIATEWLRATLFTGFAWNPLAVILVDQAQATRWIGTYGLSGLIMLAAGAVMAVHGRRSRFAALLAVPLLLSAFIPPAIPATRPTGLIRVIQPNIGQQDKWRADAELANRARMAALTGRATATPRLIFWPEAAVPDYLELEPRARLRLAALLGPRDLLLTGGTALVFDKAGEVAAARNSLFVIDATAKLHGRYDKAHLVPYGEYLPMRPLLSAIGLSRLAPGDFDFLPGPGPRNVTLPGFGTAGIQICYEMIFSGQVVDRAARPDFLFNPSNDAWFGASGPPQHLAQARLRAIEEGLPIIRSTPTGISAVIAADGRVLASLPWRTAGAIDAVLPGRTDAPFFARHGNIVPLLLALGLTMSAIAVRRARR